MRSVPRPGGRVPLRRLLVLICALGAVSVAIAGCGGGGGASAPQTPAGFVPSSFPLYIEGSANPDSPQWVQARTLAQKFPSYPKLLEELTQVFSENGLDFDRDVRPLLGERVGIALESFADEAGMVLAVELADGKEGDAVALIERAASQAGTPTPADHGGVDYYTVDDMLLAVDDGVALMADTQGALTAAIDAHDAGGDRVIANNARYTDVLAKLPADALATAYVDVGGAVAGVEDSSAALGLRLFGLSPESALGLAVTAHQNGVVLKAVGERIALLSSAEAYTPTLLNHVPRDALGYLGFTNFSGIVEGVLTALQSDPELGPELGALTGQLSGFEDELGVTLDDIRALAEDEGALVVTEGPSGASFPGIVAVLKQADGARAKQTLDTLRPTLRQVLAFAQIGFSAAGGGDPSPVPDWREVPLANGVSGWELPLDPEAGIVYGIEGDLLYIGTKPAAVREAQAPAAPLSADAAYKAASQLVPATGSLRIWANVQQILSMLDRMGAFREDAELLQNLRLVQNAIISLAGGETSTLDGFVTIR
jgi:hypothetical protein